MYFLGCSANHIRHGRAIMDKRRNDGGRNANNPIGGKEFTEWLFLRPSKKNNGQVDCSLWCKTHQSDLMKENLYQTHHENW